jgi:alpha-L-rhamnosidase
MSAPVTPEDIRTFFDDTPGSVPTRMWLYGSEQYERGTLARLVEEAFAANRYVDYPGNFRRAEPVTRFRACADRPLTVDLLVHGSARVRVSGRDVPQEEGRVWIALLAGELIEIDVHAPTREPAALGAVSPISLRWESSFDGRTWHASGTRPGNARPPHSVGEDIHLVELVDRGGHYETGGPTLGRIVVESATEPIVASGESLEEALAPESLAETRHDVERRGDNLWATVHELGFQFVVIRDAHPLAVHVESRARSTIAAGAFACSDDQLTHIWNVGAATLHACMQGLVVDGIKRDRLPWLGDHSLNLLSNAFSVGDAAISRDSLVALGAPTHGYVNGISDYSLWWLITSRFQQRYFDDAEYVEMHADHIHHFATDLLEQTDERGYFEPRGQHDGFPSAGAESIFIDWGITGADSKSTALQMLWLWALRSTAEMLESVGHPAACHWSAQADRVRSALVEDAWDDLASRWRERVRGDEGRASAYPNFLAVLSGIAPDRDSAEMVSAIRYGTVGTPFMRALALRALALLGDRHGSLAQIRDRWGPVVAAGATSFPEEFAAAGQSPYEMYGRPFGKSLCHAWGSGPVSLLPQILLGLEPGPNGWADFTIAPDLGDLDWAAARIRTVHGDITVIADRDTVRVWMPEGVRLTLADRIAHGPATITLPRLNTNFSITPPVAQTL